MSKVILINGNELEMFSSVEHLCSYIEAPSFEGTEQALQEDGMVVELFLDRGAWIKNIFGRKRYVKDFEFVNYKLINDANMKELVLKRISKCPACRMDGSENEASISDIFSKVENEVGVTY